MEEAVMEHREAVASEAASEAVAVGATRHTEACDYKSGPWVARERRSGGQQEIARFLQRRLEGLYNKQKADLVDAQAKTKLDSVLGFLDLVSETVPGNRPGGESSLDHG
jgi:hypothetical protein